MKARASRRSGHPWLLRFGFSPNPPCSAPLPRTAERFTLTRYPEGGREIELASSTDFAQRLFFRPARSDVPNGLWFFDGMRIG